MSLHFSASATSVRGVALCLHRFLCLQSRWCLASASVTGVAPGEPEWVTGSTTAGGGRLKRVCKSWVGDSHVRCCEACGLFMLWWGRGDCSQGHPSDWRNEVAGSTDSVTQLTVAVGSITAVGRPAWQTLFPFDSTFSLCLHTCLKRTNVWNCPASYCSLRRGSFVALFWFFTSCGSWGETKVAFHLLCCWRLPSYNLIVLLAHSFVFSRHSVEIMQCLVFTSWLFSLAIRIWDFFMSFHDLGLLF